MWSKLNRRIIEFQENCKIAMCEILEKYLNFKYRPVIPGGAEGGGGAKDAMAPTDFGRLGKPILHPQIFTTYDSLKKCSLCFDFITCKISIS